MLMEKLVIFFDNAPSIHKEGIIHDFSLSHDILLIHFPLLSDDIHFSEIYINEISFKDSRCKINPSFSQEEKLTKIKNFINKKLENKSYEEIIILHSFLDIYRLRLVKKLKNYCNYFSKNISVAPLLEPIRLNDLMVLPRLIKLFISFIYQKINLNSKKIFIFSSLNSFIYKIFFNDIKLTPYKKRNDKSFLLHRDPNSKKIKKGKFKILFIGKLIDRKNPMILIKAFKKLMFDAQLTIVGEGNLYRKIRNESKLIMNVSNASIKIINRVENNKINKLISDHDVLVLPSKFDGFGFVVSEAIDSKVFVIVSNEVGAKDLIKNGKIGSIFRNNSQSELQNLLNLHYLRSL